MNGGYYTVHGYHVMMNPKDHYIKIPTYIKHVNIYVTTDFLWVVRRKNSFDHNCGLLCLILISASWIYLVILESEVFAVIIPLKRE